MSRARIELRNWLRPRPTGAANDNSPLPQEVSPLSRRRIDYVILAVVIVGVALFYWLAILFVDWDRVQTCVTMGLRTCNPIIELDKQ